MKREEFINKCGAIKKAVSDAVEIGNFDESLVDMVVYFRDTLIDQTINVACTPYRSGDRSLAYISGIRSLIQSIKLYSINVDFNDLGFNDDELREIETKERQRILAG